MKRAAPATMDATLNPTVASDDESDSDWEAINTPTSSASPPLSAQQIERPSVKFVVPPGATKLALTFVKAKSDSINDSKVQQLMDDFEAFEASSDEPRSDGEDESAAQSDVYTFEGAVRDGARTFASRRASRKSPASIHIETVNGDITPGDEPFQVPADAKDEETDKNNSAAWIDREWEYLKGKMVTCAIIAALPILFALGMLFSLSTAPPGFFDHPGMVIPLLFFLGIEGWFMFEAGKDMVPIIQHPVFRQKVASAWQAFRDSLEDDDEEDEEEMTEGDKQLRQASQTIARSTLGLALVFLAMLIISPWYKVSISPLIEKFVLGVLASVWIFALSRVDWKDTTMAQEITAFIERWMPVHHVVDRHTTAQQPEQGLSLALKAMRVGDEVISFFFDMILKAILAASIGYIVLPVQTFGEVCGNRIFMSVSTVLMVKTPRLPLFEEAADGLIWAWDMVQPYVDRFTAAINQHIDRFGKYVTENKELWLANVKRFGKMAGDALLWTLNSAGRIVLASIFLHAILLCLHGYQSRQSVEVQQETPVASGVPDVANIHALPIERLNKWSDVVSLALQKVNAQSEHSEGRNKVIACPFGRGYPIVEKDDTDPEPHVEQESSAEDPQQPEPSDLSSKKHVIEPTSRNEWLQKYLDDIMGLMGEYDSLSEKLAKGMRE